MSGPSGPVNRIRNRILHITGYKLTAGNYGYDQELEGKSYPPGLKNDSLETDAGRIGFPSDALGLAPCPLRGP